ncbi:ParB/RepB/Spo0J family partition protein [uncultured Megasphaera sp.]|uniref:ParB/RepB/Spo0J family partition protein n=1 Tax=uncultured Megasphaera sp. TaxID=165188 RepID=UPI00265AF35D|nr:ParB/RepB/Spo0J family partition protein [uncultured Megasphaera sp.]
MSAKKSGLGANNRLEQALQKYSRLEALGLDKRHRQQADPAAGTVEISVDAVVPNPYQPRRSFSPEAIQALADSIRQYGLIQPIIVQKKDGGQYELVAGERRLRAAKVCGLKTIPAIIRHMDSQEAAEIALIENLQREDLNAIEEALAYKALVDEFHLTQEQAAQKVGKSRSHVANMIRLLQLPEEIRQYVSDGVLTMGQVRPLLQLPTKEQQIDGAVRIVDQELSARQAEALVRQMMIEERPSEPRKADAHLEVLQDRLKMHLGTSVAIRLDRNKKNGKIEISFTSEAEFERLLALLTDEPEEDGAPPVSSFHV